MIALTINWAVKNNLQRQVEDKFLNHSNDKGKVYVRARLRGDCGPACAQPAKNYHKQTVYDGK